MQSSNDDTNKDKASSNAKPRDEDKKVDDEKKTLTNETKGVAKNKTTIVKADIKMKATYKDVLEPSEEKIKLAKKV
jgi:hypothetical protein